MNKFITLLTIVGLSFLAACGGGDDTTPPPPATNTAPTLTGSPADVTVTVGADDQTSNLGQFFADSQDSDAALTYSVVSNSDPRVAAASISGTTLSLDFAAAGMTTIAVRATDTGGLSANTSFTVTVEPSDQPAPEARLEIDTASSTCDAAIEVGDQCTVTINLVDYQDSWFGFEFDVRLTQGSFALQTGAQDATSLTNGFLIQAGPAKVAGIGTSAVSGSGAIVILSLERVNAGNETMSLANAALVVDLEDGTPQPIQGDTSNAIF
jgi:hypothetical protein